LTEFERFQWKSKSIPGALEILHTLPLPIIDIGMSAHEVEGNTCGTHPSYPQLPVCPMFSFRL